MRVARRPRHAPAGDQVGVHVQCGLRDHQGCIPIQCPQAQDGRVELIGRDRIGLVDDEDVGHAGVRLAGMEVELVAGSQRIGDDHEQVGPVEREVVVAAVPQDHVGLPLGGLQDGAVIDAGIDDPPRVQVPLVLTESLRL